MQIMSNVIVECQIISETLFFYKVYEDLMTAALCGGCSSRWTTVLESLLAPSFDSASQHLFHLDFILYPTLVKVKVEVYYSKTFYFYCNFLFLFFKHAVWDKYGWDRQFVCLFESRMVFILPVKL